MAAQATPILRAASFRSNASEAVAGCDRTLGVLGRRLRVTKPLLGGEQVGKVGIHRESVNS